MISLAFTVFLVWWWSCHSGTHCLHRVAWFLIMSCCRHDKKSCNTMKTSIDFFISEAIQLIVLTCHLAVSYYHLHGSNGLLVKWQKRCVSLVVLVVENGATVWHSAPNRSKWGDNEALFMHDRCDTAHEMQRLH